MKIVVADAGPLISASRANSLELVRKVYGEIIIPKAVADEISTGGKKNIGAQIVHYGWIKSVVVTNIGEVQLLRLRLGNGESEAIVLAQELNATIFADEGKVISECRKRKLSVTSTLRMLLEAKQKGFITNVKEELDNFLSNGFRLSEKLYEEVLLLANEN